VLNRPPAAAPGEAPYRIYNIGHGGPVPLMEFIGAIEKAVGRKAELNLLPMQPGDVSSTYADTSQFEKDFGFKPGIPVEVGVARFVDWYRSFYQA
jgi:UDP-glucuronate 4-epimerase